MYVQQRCRGRPEDQPGGGHEASLRHPLNALLLREFRRDIQE